MKLHELKNTTLRPPRKRLGRGDGSGTGKTAGRGGKGSSARTGFRSRPYFEGGQLPFFRRLPKRGFTNPNRLEYNVVNVSNLDQSFQSGEKVDEDALRRKGIIRKPALGLKILGDGELTKPLTVCASKFSSSARRKIEAAGGACETV